MSEQITKRKVTMRRIEVRQNDKGRLENVVVGEAVDYVRPDFLDAYLEVAKQRWNEVLVSDEPDAGPGGYHGETHVPSDLSHPLAGQTFAATKPSGGGRGKASTFLPATLIGSLFLGLVLTAVMMLVRGLWTIQTAAQRNILETAYFTGNYGALYTTAPGGTAGTEVSGGSPAYARKALTGSGNAPRTATVTFDVPASTTVVGAGIHSAVTGGTYLDGTSVTSQTFASQGTYAVTFSYTQS